MWTLGKNITNIDSYIRIMLATLLVYIAIQYSNYYIISLSIFLYFSAFKKFCFFYYLFDINNEKRKHSLSISKLPYYNTSSVFIFKENGKIDFKNKTANNIFPDIESIFDFGEVNIVEIIKNNLVETLFFNYKEKNYQIDIKGSSVEKLLFVYTTDISELTLLNNEIEETQKEIIYTIGEIGETRSQETGYHVKRVALYSELLGKLYGLADTEVKDIKSASPMHDIGKIAIADNILNKPGKLTSEEFEIMKTHAELGYKMLKHSKRKVLRLSARIAYEHHEKYDGTGYPRGISGEEISIYARITAIADVFDALGSDRVYKKAWELDKILDFFKEQRSKHFDPELVDLFFENLDKFLEIRNQYKDKADM